MIKTGRGGENPVDRHCFIRPIGAYACVYPIVDLDRARCCPRDYHRKVRVYVSLANFRYHFVLFALGRPTYHQPSGPKGRRSFCNLRARPPLGDIRLPIEY